MRLTLFVLCICLSYSLAKIIPRTCNGIISRTQWNARSPIQLDYGIRPVKYVIVHHTVTPSCNNLLKCSTRLESIQNYHMDELDMDDIVYNFMIDSSGHVYEGRGWNQNGAHTRNYNSKSIGVAFIGNYNDNFASDAQLDSLEKLMECGQQLGELSTDYKVIGAKQVSSTRSPGTRLYRQLQSFPRWESDPS